MQPTRCAGRFGLVCAIVLLFLGPAAARAQSPGQTLPHRPAPHAGYAALNAEEREILARGEIGGGQTLGGGLVGTFVGLGLGHAVQGRYLERGWVFTGGEVGSLGLFLIGSGPCLTYGEDEDVDCSLMVVGLVSFSLFRIWELVDVWVGPALHNHKVERLRQRIRRGPRYGFTLLPRGDSGATLGFSLRF